MAGKINKQAKTPRLIQVNGKWKHPNFDSRPLAPKLAERLAEIGQRLGVRSL